MFRPHLQDFVLLGYEFSSIWTPKQRWSGIWWDSRTFDCRRSFYVNIVCITLHFPQLELNGAVDVLQSVFLRIMLVCQVGSALFLIRYMISVWFSSNQSLSLLVDGPKYSLAVLYTMSLRGINAASTSCTSKRIVSNSSSKGSINDCLVETSFSFAMFSRLGAFLPCSLLLGRTVMLSLEMIWQWSVLYSAPYKTLVTLTSRLSLRLRSDASA